MSDQDGDDGKNGKNQQNRKTDGDNPCDIVGCICDGAGGCDGPGCVAALAFILVLGLAYGLYYLVAMLFGGPQTWAEWRESGALFWSTLGLAALAAFAAACWADAHWK
ncbi:MAG TPA: hypothetical protein VG889_01675 [Rhizomicrobium sp.]|nr:hypothetical protein [Rhizomicrobium sp.]